MTEDLQVALPNKYHYGKGAEMSLAPGQNLGYQGDEQV